VRSALRWPYSAPHSASASSAHQRVDKRRQQFAQDIGVGSGESTGQQLRPVDIVGSGHRVDSLCSSDFGRSLEESRDDLHSLGYNTPGILIGPDSYTTLLDATFCCYGRRRHSRCGLVSPIDFVNTSTGP
jgi:hypothetical protein